MSIRSTTPPLFYRRPEGFSVPYYTVGATKEAAPSLRVLPSAFCAKENVMPTAAARVSSSEQTVRGLPSSSSTGAFASLPAVANPFGLSNAPPQVAVTAENSADVLRQSVSRWSTCAGDVASALEAEEAALLTEEQSVRAQLAELQLTRQRQCEEQVELSHGWAALLDREERYFTEPFVDLSPEIAAREQQCVLLRDQLQQAEGHLRALRQELQQYDAVVEEKNSLEAEMRRVLDSFLALEGRRKACVVRAERVFDVESRRAAEAARRGRELEQQLKNMSSSGPLAETLLAPHSLLASRGVTFAQKSIIIDDGGEEEEAECAGLTQGVGGDTSICLQDDCEENNNNNDDDGGDDVGGIGGSSATYPLGILKRQRVEVPSA